MKVESKIKIEVSLREARMLARIISAASSMLYDGNLKSYHEQSECWHVAVEIESALRCGIREFVESLGMGDAASMIAWKWGGEPLQKGFGSVFAKGVRNV